MSMEFTNYDEELNESLLSEIDINAKIPEEISLKRIKKRTMRRINKNFGHRYMKRAIAIPVFLVIIFASLGVYAYSTNLWDLFFKRTDVTNPTYGSTFPSISITDAEYTITLLDASLEKHSGLILLSLERTDNKKIDGHPHLQANISYNSNGYSSFGYSNESALSDDRKTMYYCYFLNSSTDLTAGDLKLTVDAIENITTNFSSWDLSLQELCSSDYSDIMPFADQESTDYDLNESQVEELYKRAEKAGDLQKSNHMENISVVAAEVRNNSLYVITQVVRDISDYTWMTGIYDSRTGRVQNADRNRILGHSNEYGSFDICVFDNYSIEDLQFLYPYIKNTRSDNIVEGNWAFTVDHYSSLQEIDIVEGFNTLLYDGVNIDSLTISPVGVIMAFSGDNVDGYEKFTHISNEAVSYLLLENNQKVILKNQSSSTTSEDGKNYSANAYWRTWVSDGNTPDISFVFIDTSKVKAVYINDRLVWER